MGARRLGFLAAAAAALAGGLATAGPASTDPLERKLTLAECILLAVKNNRDLAANRLGRRTDRLALKDAEDTFRPVPTLGLSATRDWTATKPRRSGYRPR